MYQILTLYYKCVVQNASLKPNHNNERFEVCKKEIEWEIKYTST